MSSERQPRRSAASGVLFATFAGGFAIVSISASARQNRMAPWIVGRGLGVAAYLALTAVVLLGTWYSHPWRFRRPVLHPAVQLRAHAVLASATLALVAGHVSALILDRYARVGVGGAFIPGTSGYRPGAVALGTVALYLGAAAGGTAALAGRILAGHRWLEVHRFAALVFVTCWFHGVLAGSDTPALRPMYIVTGVAVLVLTVTRHAARSPEFRTGGNDAVRAGAQESGIRG